MPALIGLLSAPDCDVLPIEDSRGDGNCVQAAVRCPQQNLDWTTIKSEYQAVVLIHRDTVVQMLCRRVRVDLSGQIPEAESAVCGCRHRLVGTHEPHICHRLAVPCKPRPRVLSHSDVGATKEITVQYLRSQCPVPLTSSTQIRQEQHPNPPRATHKHCNCIELLQYYFATTYYDKHHGLSSRLLGSMWGSHQP